MVLQVAAPTIAYNATANKLIINWIANPEETLTITKYAIEIYSYYANGEPGTPGYPIDVDINGITSPYSIEVNRTLEEGQTVSCDVITYAGEDVSEPSELSNILTIGAVVSPWTNGIHNVTGGPYDENGNGEDGNPYLPESVGTITVTDTIDGFLVEWVASPTGGTLLYYTISNTRTGKQITETGTSCNFIYSPTEKYGNTFAFSVTAVLPLLPSGTITSMVNVSTDVVFELYAPYDPVIVSYTYTIDSVTINFRAGIGDYSSPTFRIVDSTDDALVKNIYEASNTEFSYTFTGLPSTNPFIFYVRAENSEGQSNWVDTGSIDLNVIQLSVPDAPTNVVATSINSGNNIEITWDAPAFNGNSANTGYKVYDGAVKGNLLGETDPDETVIRIANIAPRRGSFQAFITALNIQGESEVSEGSNLLDILPLAGPLPAAPKILAPVLGNLTITLSWTAVSAAAAPITGYRVRRSDDITYSLLIEGVDTKTWTITDGLVAGTPVSFTVSSVNANGDCLVPASITVTPISTPAQPPYFVAYVGKIRGTALLYWTPPPPSDGGTPLTGYILTYNEIVINLGPVNTFMVYIKDGVAVEFSLVSKNKVGVSTAVAAAINGVYVDPTEVIPTIPDPPLGIVAYVGLPGTVYLYWLPQAPSNGGSPLTGHILTYNGITMNLPGTALKFFDNVVPEQGITFRLVAKNKNGLSAEVLFELLGGGDVTDAIIPRIP